jgi:hypothetical protein
LRFGDCPNLISTSFQVALWIPGGKLPLSSKGEIITKWICCVACAGAKTPHRLALRFRACGSKGIAAETRPSWFKYEHSLTIR